jgi:hypothetical protein
VNLVVVARYEEDVSWINDLPGGWSPFLVQKGVDMPNEGREGGSFLWAIDRLYPALRRSDRIVFLQGAPHEHAEQIELDVPGFTHIGHEMYVSDGAGAPNHPGLPVAQLYEQWLSRPFPGSVRFAAGGQFGVTGADLLARPRAFWRRLGRHVCSHREGPWVMERIWEDVFCHDSRTK